MFRFGIRLRAAISLSPSPKTEYLYSARMMLSRGSDERLVDERTIYHAAKRTTVSPVNRNVKHGSGEYRWHFEPALQSPESSVDSGKDDCYLLQSSELFGSLTWFTNIIA